MREIGKISEQGSYTELLERKGEFADFDILGDTAEFVSETRSDKRPIIHWISETDCIEAKLIHPKEGEILTIDGFLEKHNYEPGTMVQIERIGYGILVDNSTVMFTHDQGNYQNPVHTAPDDDTRDKDHRRTKSE